MSREPETLPAGDHSVNPYFVVSAAEAFIDFLVTVFGGAELGEREVDASGSIRHADALVGDSLIMMSEADAL